MATPFFPHRGHMIREDTGAIEILQAKCELGISDFKTQNFFMFDQKNVQKVQAGMANSVEPDWTSPLVAI